MIGRQVDGMIHVWFCRDIEEAGCLMTLLQTKLLQISPATLLAGHRRRKYFVPVTSDTYCLLMADAVLWT